jgi:phosphoribosylanthranilate isomerase
MKVKSAVWNTPITFLKWVHSYQIIWDLSFGKNHRGIILMVSSLLYRIDKKKVGVLLMKHSLLSKVLKHDLQVVQLHGKESVDFCQNCEANCQRYWNYKVFSIQDEFDFSALKPFEEFCDYFYDTKGKLPGGNGTTFDWTVLKNILRQSRFSQRWDRTRRIKSSYKI